MLYCTVPQLAALEGGVSVHLDPPNAIAMPKLKSIKPEVQSEKACTICFVSKR